MKTKNPIYFTVYDAIEAIDNKFLKQEILYLLDKLLREQKEKIEEYYEEEIKDLQEQLKDLQEQLKYLEENSWH